MKDQYGRTVDYMRISVTDRCNLRCVYCMPEGIEKVSMDKLLTYEEILYVVRAAVVCGITRFKLTGGEPLVRKGIEKLVAGMKQIQGVEQVTLTTNGILLKDYLPKLLDAGLDAVNISLDTMDRAEFKAITGSDSLPEVLEGLNEVVEANIPVKVNATVWTGKTSKMSEPDEIGKLDMTGESDETEWEPLLFLARDMPVDVRFIELMPIGAGASFSCISTEEIKNQIFERYSGVEEDSSPHGNGPASYIRIPGFKGSIGFISAVHGKFCDRCNRLRLTSMGMLKPCLCYGEGIDVSGILRPGDSLGISASSENGDDVMMGLLTEAVKKAVLMKPAGHCFENPMYITEHKKMNEIGG